MSVAAKKKASRKALLRLASLADNIEAHLSGALMAPDEFIRESVRDRIRRARETAIILRNELEKLA